MLSAQGLDHGLGNHVRHVSATVAGHLCGEARLEETWLGSYEMFPFSCCSSAFVPDHTRLQVVYPASPSLNTAAYRNRDVHVLQRGEACQPIERAEFQHGLGLRQRSETEMLPVVYGWLCTSIALLAQSVGA